MDEKKPMDEWMKIKMEGWKDGLKIGGRMDEWMEELING